MAQTRSWPIGGNPSFKRSALMLALELAFISRMHRRDLATRHLIEQVVAPIRASEGNVAPHSEHWRMGLFACALRRLNASSTACLLIPSSLAAAEGGTPESTFARASLLLDILLSTNLNDRCCNTCTLTTQVINVTTRQFTCCHILVEG